MTVPPEVSGFMPMVSPWFTIDEDDMRTESAASRATATQGASAAAQGETAVRGAGQHYGGESGTALQAHWDRTGLSGGHLDQAANAARLAPVGLEGAANVVSGVKVATIVQAAHASVDVARLLALGAAAGGTAFAVRRILMARAANRKIRNEGVQGTGNVLGQLLRRRVTEPGRRILDDLHRLNGPRGTPALAGTGGRSVPMRPAGLRTQSGPRSVRDGIAQMGRRNNRAGSGGGRRGGGGRARRDGSGKLHGDLPRSTKGMTEEEKYQLQRDLEQSIKKREAEKDRFGILDSGHETRLNAEKSLLRRILGL
ncbi:hypothetical protein FE391_35315 [Nonomuraea sp. KC401]|uniref:hypothetical protein n=1 Tax=unclassified Nonomuraea TaxID=2593643 RepID=UPI0010FE95A4|nr:MULTISPECIES: hypothetical protein [unclassified Nonomuraea]NBE98876.1 hypothetical protein [Nonomuraea sp. K271]TLF59037.1 hypothetical protein FE391_35315 [Nonomuraea sp. KC401]